MATLVKTFSFTADVESFAWHREISQVVMAWYASEGNPTAGSLSSELALKNKVSANYWDRTLTWEDMGIPAGSVITGVIGASMDYKCIVAGSLDTATAGNVTLVDGATTIELSQAASFSAVHGTWQTSNGVDSTGLSLASSNNVLITINNYFDSGGVSVSNEFLQDNLTFTITYEAPVLFSEQGTIGVIDVNGAASSLVLGVAPSGTTGVIGVNGLAGSLALGQNLTGSIGAIEVVGYVSQLPEEWVGQGITGAIAVTGLAGSLNLGWGAGGSIAQIDTVGLAGSIETGSIIQGTNGHIAIIGYNGSLARVLARINSTLGLKIKGVLTEDALATKEFYDSAGNLGVAELIEGATFYMDQNNKLTVVTFEEEADI